MLNIFTYLIIYNQSAIIGTAPLLHVGNFLTLSVLWYPVPGQLPFGPRTWQRGSKGQHLLNWPLNGQSLTLTKKFKSYSMKISFNFELSLQRKSFAPITGKRILKIMSNKENTRLKILKEFLYPQNTLLDSWFETLSLKCVLCFCTLVSSVH